ncbi:MAG: hypothetical protein AB1762_03070 [Gemmatimonadota bacterium]
MAAVRFSDLPDDARVWVFAASDTLTGEKSASLLEAVDSHLNQWAAHGFPLTCARDWRDDHFLAIGVDQRDAHASGCSIDGLFRTLQKLELALGTKLVGAGRVFYRAERGDVVCLSRADFTVQAARGAIAADTPVFDTSVTTAGEYRERFEQPAKETWHAALLG